MTTTTAPKFILRFDEVRVGDVVGGSVHVSSVDEQPDGSFEIGLSGSFGSMALISGRADAVLTLTEVGP